MAIYWSLPVLRGVLPKEYYIHDSLLVVGCRLLCGEKVTHSEIDHARRVLLKFYERHEHLYGMFSYLELNRKLLFSTT